MRGTMSDKEATKARRQAAFDTMVRHLRKQGRPSVEARGCCRYRGPDGTKCAIGALISDDAYSPRLEGRGGQDYLIIEAAGMEAGDGLFLADCQFNLHDCISDPEGSDFTEELSYAVRHVAELWGLEVPD